MSETDALSNFDFSKVQGVGLFVKFEAGRPLTLRVLTVDPIVSQVEYTDKKTGEISINTKFAFIVYNFTDEKAQILQASPTVAKKIGELHVDKDFGANIREIDIKITPSGEKLERRYDIQVLPRTNELTAEHINQCRMIDLDGKVEGERMSFYKPPTPANQEQSVKDSILAAREAEERAGRVPDTIVPMPPEGTPIDINDIPF